MPPNLGSLPGAADNGANPSGGAGDPQRPSRRARLLPRQRRGAARGDAPPAPHTSGTSTGRCCTVLARRFYGVARVGCGVFLPGRGPLRPSRVPFNCSLSSTQAAVSFSCLPGFSRQALAAAAQKRSSNSQGDRTCPLFQPTNSVLHLNNPQPAFLPAWERPEPRGSEPGRGGASASPSPLYRSSTLQLARRE